MELRDILNEDAILINWTPASKEEAITTLVDALDQASLLVNKEQVLQDVMERESNLSTGLEEGIAYPHARSNGVRQVVMAFGIVKGGLQFDSRDQKPALFIPLMVSPRTGGAPHIYFMAEIVKLLEKEEIRNQLLNTSSPAEVYRILTGARSPEKAG